jgi:hypothetical protein
MATTLGSRWVFAKPHTRPAIDSSGKKNAPDTNESYYNDAVQIGDKGGVWLAWSLDSAYAFVAPERGVETPDPGCTQRSIGTRSMKYGPLLPRRWGTA